MKAVLVDTSVWVDHFKHRNDALLQLLNADLVLTHPLVQGELACGTPPAPRAQTLRDLELLQTSQQASLRETIHFIEREALYGLGCGLVDILRKHESMAKSDLPRLVRPSMHQTFRTRLSFTHRPRNSSVQALAMGRRWAPA